MTASDGASKYKVVETPASGKVSCYEIDSSGTENLVSETTESDNSIQAKYYRGSATDTVTVNMSDYGNVTSMFYDGKAVEYGYFFHPTSGYASQMTYDPAGNPLQWKGNVLQWDRGRRLIGYGSNGYTYDSGGIRQSKTVNGITHTYYTEDGTIHKEELSDGNKLIYGYDESGIASIEYGNTRYYVQKNVQGDVVALVDGNKAVVAKYIYDAWGDHKVLDAAGTENTSDDFIGNINPIRYRGYYYDTETNLYYLINRYYDSETGRFISPDYIGYALMNIADIDGLNLYAYCLNNPVIYSDPEGTIVGSALAFGVIGLMALFGLFVVYEVETTYHPIENAYNGLTDAVSDAINSVDTSNDINIGRDWYIKEAHRNKRDKKRKGKKGGPDTRQDPDQRAAPRLRYPTRKKAKEAAERLSKGMGLRYEKNKFGKHFHPLNPKFKHWHFYFSSIIALILSLFDDEDDGYII